MSIFSSTHHCVQGVKQDWLMDGMMTLSIKIGLSLARARIHIVVLGFLHISTSLAFPQISTIEAPEEKDVEPARFYRSPEERREAGLGTPITDWLTFFGLLEAEYEYSRVKYRDGNTLKEYFDTEAVQIGLEAEFTDKWFGEFVFEIEHDQKFRSFLDEGVIALEMDDSAIKFGILNLDFGEYYSHFVIGPALEFGETRKWALAYEKELTENIEAIAYTFDNEGSNISSDLGWGIAAEWVSEDEAFRVGTGLLSDLRQSDDFFLEEDYANATNVPGWSMYALFGFDSYEITAEVVTATDYFTIEDDRMRPQAYNLELAYFINYDFQIAARLEHNKDLIDEPERRSGLAITWLFGDHLILSVDYLYGTFEKPVFFEEEEEYLKSLNQIAAQVGFEF